MPNCHEMRKGEIYVCEDCGLELQVISECKEVGTPASECGCHTSDEIPDFTCCDTVSCQLNTAFTFELLAMSQK